MTSRPLSALQHLLFCERQCALIHNEQLWAENQLTAEGRVMHEKAHDGPDETRDGVRIVRGLRLRCERLGLHGVADVVEFHRMREDRGSATIPDRPGGPPTGSAGVSPPSIPPPAKPQAPLLRRAHEAIIPVEYKRGKPKRDDSDRVQLCAQALCLEEMCDIVIPRGFLYYGRNRRRHTVEIAPDLRQVTESAAARLHALLDSGETPTAVREPKCNSCSLLDLCLPDALRFRHGVAAWNERQFAAALNPEP